MFIVRLQPDLWACVADEPGTVFSRPLTRGRARRHRNGSGRMAVTGIDLKTAKALGLDIPPARMTQANEVVK
jgi:hypothetical protein